jgi:hypothetical protein
VDGEAALDREVLFTLANRRRPLVARHRLHDSTIVRTTDINAEEEPPLRAGGARRKRGSDPRLEGGDDDLVPD